MGSGSGFMVLAMALISGKECGVFGVEHVKELVGISVENIRREN